MKHAERNQCAGLAELDTFTVREAAEYLKLGYDAMKDLIDRGEVPAASCNQKHTVVLRDDLRDWIRTLAQKQAAERRSEYQRSHLPKPTRGRTRRALPGLPPLPQL